MSNKKIVFFCIFVTLLLFISCSKKDKPLIFDSSEPLAIEPGVEWLLVISPYVPCHKEGGYESLVVEHLRRGEIRMVEGNCVVKTDEEYENWYKIKEGWIPQNSVAVFSNKLKAQKALSQLP